MCSVEPTNLLWVPEVKEVQETLVAHLFVSREHDDVPTEVKATSPHSRTRLQQGKLLPWKETLALSVTPTKH